MCWVEGWDRRNALLEPPGEHHVLVEKAQSTGHPKWPGAASRLRNERRFLMTFKGLPHGWLSSLAPRAVPPLLLHSGGCDRRAVSTWGFMLCTANSLENISAQCLIYLLVFPLLSGTVDQSYCILYWSHFSFPTFFSQVLKNIQFLKLSHTLIMMFMRSWAHERNSLQQANKHSGNSLLQHSCA